MIGLLTLWCCRYRGVGKWEWIPIVSVKEWEEWLGSLFAGKEKP
jgi:hypothetical protein